jgi:hypothetical protein
VPVSDSIFPKRAGQGVWFGGDCRLETEIVSLTSPGNTVQNGSYHEPSD